MGSLVPDSACLQSLLQLEYVGIIPRYSSPVLGLLNAFLCCVKVESTAYCQV